MGLDDFKTNQEVKTIDTSKKLRIGFIGCGWIADSHMRSFLKQPDVEIVAGADLIPGKAKAFMEKHGVEGVKTDYASHQTTDKGFRTTVLSPLSYFTGFEKYGII